MCKSLINDPIVFLLQIKVVGTDTGYPAKNTSRLAEIKILVSRNKESPRFERNLYTRNLPETTKVSASALQVRANDGDREVSTDLKFGILFFVTFSAIGS